MESNPFRVIPLLSISLPCRGIIFFRYRERSRGRLILESDFEESRVVALRRDCPRRQRSHGTETERSD